MASRPFRLGALAVIGLIAVLFAFLGIAVGIGLSYWEPDDMETKDKVLKWLGLIGDLFIRALK